MNLNSAPAYENRKISLQNCRPIASTDCRFLVASVAHVWAALHGSNFSPVWHHGSLIVASRLATVS